MNTRAFTILETVLATILATLLIIGTAAVFQNMQSQTTKFKTSVDQDMRWVEANRHLVENVHASSFLAVPNANTLELYDYNGDAATKAELRGTYTSTATTITYTDGTAKLGGAVFPGVSATFSPASPASPGKGWKGPKLIEAVINYSAPFTSTLRLRCAVSVKSSAIGSTWTLQFTGVDFKNVICIQNGYVAVGSLPFGGDIFIVKVDKDGNVIWKYTYHIFPTYDPSFICQTVTAAGVPDGYIVTGHDVGSIFLLRLNTQGQPVWQKTYYCGGTSTYYGFSVSQSFSSSSPYAVDGYIVSGLAGYTTYSDGCLLKVDTNGNAIWQKIYHYTCSPSSPAFNGFFSLQATTDSLHKPNGYIVGAMFYTSLNDGCGLTRLGLNGNHMWSRFSYGNSSRPLYYIGNCVQQAFTPAGLADGYILAGSATEGSLLKGKILKTDDSGTVAGSIESDDVILNIQQAYNDLGVLDGYIATSTSGSVIRLNSDGTIRRTLVVGRSAGAYPSNFIKASLDALNKPDGYIQSVGYFLLKMDTLGNTNNNIQTVSIPVRSPTLVPTSSDVKGVSTVTNVSL